VKDLELLPAPEKRTGRRVAGALAGVLVTGALLLLALYLGAWAYETRSLLLHEKRLSTLLEKKPGVAAVSAGLRAEGRVEAAFRDGEEIAAFAREVGGARGREILEKSRRALETRAYSQDTVVYVIYFDRAGIMNGFTLVTWRGRAKSGG
jgi:hypothetical protein